MTWTWITSLWRKPLIGISMLLCPVNVNFPCRRVWTMEEDEAIRQMVAKYGTKSWALIAENLSQEFSIAGRSGKQCRERWHNHLGKSLVGSHLVPR